MSTTSPSTTPQRLRYDNFTEFINLEWPLMNTAPVDHDVLTHPQKTTPGELPPTPMDCECFNDLAADDTAMTQVRQQLNFSI
jgi:hypothetical protein